MSYNNSTTVSLKHTGEEVDYLSTSEVESEAVEKECRDDYISDVLDLSINSNDLLTTDYITYPKKEESNQISSPAQLQDSVWWNGSESHPPNEHKYSFDPSLSESTINSNINSSINDQIDFPLNLVSGENNLEATATNRESIPSKEIDNLPIIEVESLIHDKTNDTCEEPRNVIESSMNQSVKTENEDKSNDPCEEPINVIESSINQSVKTENEPKLTTGSIENQIIDVENETFVDLTADDDDDDDIEIVSIEEPIMYLGSEQRPFKRKRRLTHSDDLILTDSQVASSSMAGTSSNRGRVRSPVLFRDLLDTAINIADITDISEEPTQSTLSSHMNNLPHRNAVSSTSFEQQVINDISNNPHSDEIAEDLRNYEQSLRQASRTLYDIQGRDFTDTSAVSFQPSSPHPSTAGLLLKNMFFPTLSVSSNISRVPKSAADILKRPNSFSSLLNNESGSLFPTEVSASMEQSSSNLVNFNKPTTSPTITSKSLSQPSTSAVPMTQAGELACPICFEPFSDLKKNGKVMCSTICGHMFCKTCLESALLQCKQCPTCRKKLSKKQYHNIYLNFV